MPWCVLVVGSDRYVAYGPLDKDEAEALKQKIDTTPGAAVESVILQLMPYSA